MHENYLFAYFCFLNIRFLRNMTIRPSKTDCIRLGKRVVVKLWAPSVRGR